MFFDFKYKYRSHSFLLFASFLIFLSFSPSVHSQQFTVTSSAQLSGDAADGYINAEEVSSTDALLVAPTVSVDEVVVEYAVKRSDEPIAICNASVGTYATAMPMVADISTDGIYYVCNKFSKSGYLTLYSTPLKIIRDTMLPEVAEGPFEFAVTVGTPTVVDLTEIFSGSDVYHKPTSSDTEILTVVASGDPPSLTLTGGIAGDVTVTTSASDTAGNSAEATISVTVSLPNLTFTTPPALSGEASDGYINSDESDETTPVVTEPVTSATATTLQYVLKQATSPISLCDVSTGTYTSSIPTVADFSTDGKYYLCVEATKSGYISVYSSPLTIVLDTVAPSILATETAYNVETNESLTIDLDTIFSNASSYATSTSSAAREIFTENLEDTTLSLTGVAAGSDTLIVTASDIAGNIEQVTLTISVVLPTIAITTFPQLANEASDGYINAQEASEETAVLTEPQVTTEQVTAEYALRRSVLKVSACDASTSTYTSTIPTVSSFSSDGDHYLCVRFLKQGYAPEYLSPFKIIRDTVGPTVPESNFERTVFIEHSSTYQISEFGSGFSTYTPATTAATAIATATFPSDAETIVLAGIASGETTLSFPLLDEAGNSTRVVITITVIPRPLPSPIANPQLANEASDGYINAQEASKTTELLIMPTPDAGEEVTIGYLVKKSTTAISVCDNSTGEYGEIIPTISNLSSDGDYYLCTRFVKERFADLYFTPLKVVRDTESPNTNAAALRKGVVIHNSTTFDLTTIVSNASTYTLSQGADASIATASITDTLLTVTGIALGETTVTFISTDLAGNATTATVTLSVTLPPVPVITSPQLLSPADDGYINLPDSQSSTFQLITTPTVAVTEHTINYALIRSATAITQCDATTGTYSTTSPNSSQLTSDGMWHICVQLSRAGYRNTYFDPFTITRDTSGPTITNITDVSNAATNHTVTATLSDDGSGLSFYQLKVLGADSVCDITTDFDPAVTVSPENRDQIVTEPVTLSSSEDQKLCLKATDLADNSSFATSATTVALLPLPSIQMYLPGAGGQKGAEFSSGTWTSTDTLLLEISNLPVGSVPTIDLSGCYGCKIEGESVAIQSDDNGSATFTLVTGGSNLRFGPNPTPTRFNKDRLKRFGVSSSMDNRKSLPVEFIFGVDKDPPVASPFPSVRGLNGTWTNKTIPRTLFEKSVHDSASGVSILNVFGFVDQIADCNATTDTSSFLNIHSIKKDAFAIKDIKEDDRWILATQPKTPRIEYGSLNGKYLCMVLRDRVGNITTQASPYPVRFDKTKPKFTRSLATIPLHQRSPLFDVGFSTIDLSEYITDNLPLTFSVTSESIVPEQQKSIIAEVEGSILTLTPKSIGFSLITVQATDAAGNLSAKKSFLSYGTDYSIPTLVSANIPSSGDAIVLTFSESLNTNSIPAISAFSLNLTPKTGYSNDSYFKGTVTVTDKTVTLPLDIYWSHPEALTVSYATPSTNPLKDLRGNKVDSFSTTSVTVNADPPSDIAPPSLQIYFETNQQQGLQTEGIDADSLFYSTDTSAFLDEIPSQFAYNTYVIVDDNPTEDTLVTGSNRLFIDQVESASRCPATASDFSGSVASIVYGGVPEVITQQLSMSQSVIERSNLTNSTKRLCIFVDDLAGNTNSGVIETQKIPLGPPDTTAPTLRSAAISSSGDALILTFSEKLSRKNLPTLTDALFSLSPVAQDAEGSRIPLIQEGVLSDSGESITFPLSVLWGKRTDTAIVYTPPDTNFIQDISGNKLAAFHVTTISVPAEVLDPEEEQFDNKTPAFWLYEESGRSIGLQTEGQDADLPIASAGRSSGSQSNSSMLPREFSNAFHIVVEDSTTTSPGSGIEYFLSKVIDQSEACPSTLTELSESGSRFFGAPRISTTISSEQLSIVSFQGRTLCLLFSDINGNLRSFTIQEVPSSRFKPAEQIADGYLSIDEASTNFNLITLPPNSSTIAEYSIRRSATPVTICDGSEFIDDNARFSRAPHSLDLTTDGTYYLCARGAEEIDDTVRLVYSDPIKIIRDTIAPRALTDRITIITGAPIGIDLSNLFTGAVTYTANDPADTNVVTAVFTTPNLALTGATPGSTTIAVSATDEAGNQTVTTLTVTVALPDITVTTQAALTGEASDGYINAAEATETSALLTAPTISTSTTTVQYATTTSSTPLLTCDATTGTYSTSIPTVSDLSVDGNHYLCVAISKQGYNTQYATPLKVVRDIVAPTADAEATTQKVTIGTPVTVDLSNLFTGAVTYTANDPADTNVVTAVFTTPNLALTGATPGSTTIAVSATDEAGNQTVTTLTVTVALPDITVTTQAALTGEASDGYINAAEATETSALLTAPTISTSTTTVQYATTTSSTPLLTCDATTGTYSTSIPTVSDLSVDGNHYLCVAISKQGYNTQYATPLKVVRDIVAPTADAEATTQKVTIGTPVTVDLSNLFTGAVTYTANDPADTNVVTAVFTAPNLALTGATPGSTTIAVSATDEAGNQTVTTLTVTVALPDITVTTQATLTGEASDGYINAAEATETSALLTAPTISTSTTTVQYATTTSSTPLLTCDATTGTYSTSIPTVSDLSVDGNHYLCVAISKQGYNTQYATPLKVVRDIVAPTADAEATTQKVTIGTPVTVDLSNLFTGAVTYTANDPADTNVVTAVFTTPNLALTGATPGSTTIAVSATDEAGNQTVTTLTVTVALPDITVTTQAALTGEASDGYINAAEATETSALLTAPTISTSTTTVQYATTTSSTPLLTCDATTGTYSTSIPTVSDLSVDGNHYLCVAISKQGYNTQYATPLKVVRDIVAPTADAEATTQKVTIGTPVTVDLSNLFTGAVTYTANDPADTNVVTAVFTTPNLALTGATPGSTTIAVSATDEAGNQTVTTLTVTVALPDITVTTQATLTGEASDGYINAAEATETSALLTAPTISTSTTTVQYATTTSSTPLLTCDATTGTYSTSIPTVSDLSVDGNHYLCVAISKQGYNTQYATPLKVVRDIVAPTADVEATTQKVTIGTPVTVDLSNLFTGAVTYTANDPADTNVVTAVFTTPNLALTGATPGSTTIAVSATDEAGNQTVTTLTVTVALPDITVTTQAALTGEASDGYINAAEATETSALLTAPTISTSTTTVQYATTTSSTPLLTCDATTGTYSTSIPTVSDLSVDGNHYLCVAISKQGYNTQYATPLKVVRDIVAPTADVEATTQKVTIGTPVTVDLSNLFTGAVTYTANDPADTNVVTAVFTTPNLALTGATPGSTTIAVSATDEAGNQTVTTLTVTVALPDITVTTQAALTGEASDGYINAAEATETSALLTAPTISTSTTTVQYATTTSSTPLLTCDATTGTYSTSIPTVSDLSVDGNHYLCVAISKQGYNTQYATPLKVVRDIVAPTADVEATTQKVTIGTPVTVDLSNLFTGAVTYTANDPADTNVVTAVFTTPNLALTGATPGSTTIAVSATDEAGNQTVTTLTVTVALPDITVTTQAALTGEASDGYINAAEATETSALLTAPTISTSTTTVQYATTTSSTPLLTCDATTGTYSTSIPTVSDLSVDGNHYLCVAISKQGYNTQYATPLKVVRDIVAPTADVEATTQKVTIGTPVTVDLSNLFTGAVTYTANDPADTNVVTAVFTTPNLALTGATPGSTTIAVSATDEAGNQTVTTLTVTVALPDITVTTQAALTGEASDGYINAAEATETSALLTAPTISTSTTTVQYATTTSSTPLLTCDATTGTYSTSIPTVSDLSVDGNHYLCVAISKQGYNTQYATPLKVVRDIVAPTQRYNFRAGEEGVIGGILILDLLNVFVDGVTFGIEINQITPEDKNLRVTEALRTAFEKRRGPSWFRIHFYRTGTADITYWATDAAGNRGSTTVRSVTPISHLFIIAPMKLNPLFAEDDIVNASEFAKFPDEELIHSILPGKGDILGPSKATYKYLLLKREDATHFVCDREDPKSYVDRKPILSDLSSGDGVYALCAEIARDDAPDVFVTGYADVPTFFTLDTTPPKKKGDIPAQQVVKGESVSIAMNEYVTAEEGNTYSVSTDDSDVATVSVSDEGVLSVEAEGVGSTTISVIVSDKGKNSLSLSFTISVATSSD